MRFEDFNFFDGLLMSGAAILMVFVLLTLLYLMIYLMNFLPKEALVPKNRKTRPEEIKMEVSPSDEEDEMVAMLTAAAVAKDTYGGDIRIKSVKRIQ